MTRHLLFGLIRFLMMSTLFLSMMMILALWGVVGKTSYTDLDATKQGIAFGAKFGAKEAKNYLVNETKNIDQCPEKLKGTDIGPKKENPMPKKIDWEHVV